MNNPETSIGSSDVANSSPHSSESLENCTLVNGVDGITGPVLLQKPEAGQDYIVELEVGRKYVFDFAKDDVSEFVRLEDGLQLSFEDGSEIVLVNFDQAMEDNLSSILKFISTSDFSDLDIIIEEPAQSELRDAPAEIAQVDQGSGEDVTLIEPAAGEEQGGEDVTLVDPSQFAEIEPAAGGNTTGAPTSSRDGYGFQSSFDPQGIISIEDVGPINPTALQYDLPEVDDETFFDTEESGATASQPPQPIIEVGTLFVYEDGSIQGNFFASPDSPNGNMEIIISDIPPGWTVTGPGVFDPVAGTYTYNTTGGAALTPADNPTFFPPADSDVDAVELEFTVTETDPSTGLSGTDTANFDIIVDAVADDPEITAEDDSGDEGTPLDVDLSALTGEEVNNGVGSDDGSETIVKYQISGIPDGFTPSAGTEVSPGVWEFTPDEIIGLTITPDDPNFSGSINLVATVFTTENPTSDADFDFTNNDNQASDPFTLTWNPVIQPPSVTVNQGVDDVIVKEDGTVDVPITAALGDNPAAGEFLTVTVTGIDPSWGFSAPIGTYDDTTGTWTVVLAPGESLDTLLTFTPPADSDIDLSGLVATATATDPDAGISADSAPDSFNIIVDAVADDPEITAEDDSGDEGTPLDVDLSALTGEEVNNGVGSDDGSETIVKYQISGIPDGFTPSAGTEVSPGVWEFTPDEIIGLTITPDDPNFSGSINLVATVFTTENPTSDADFDFTNNDNQASDPFTLTWNPVIQPPSVTVNQGVDDVIVKEDGTVDVPITAALGDNPAAGEFLTVTVTGIDPSWGFSAPIGTYDDTTGTWTVVLAPGESLDTLLTFTPPADSDIDLSGLVATATATDPDAGISADSAPDSFNIIVDAVADDPEITAEDDSGDEGTPLDVDLSALTGEEVNNGVGSDDGSETIVKYQISGIPDGFTPSAGTEVSPGVWEFTPDEIIGLTITPDDPNFSGSINLVATVFTTENPTSDADFDFTNNDNQASDPFTLTWNPVIQPPSVTVNQGVDDVIVKEDGTVDVPITAALGDNPAAGEFLTVTVTGIDPSWGFSAPIGTYDDTTGTWTVVLAPGESLDTLLTFTPPADSDIDLSGLVATATATDPDAGISADSAPDSFNIIVDAVADDPEITAEDDSGDEGTPLDVDLSALTGEEVNNGVGSDDGSETIVKYQISGIPDGFTPSAGTEVSPGVWEFTPDEIIGLTITPDDPNFSGSINLVATVFTTENPGDGEPDSADNTNSASDPFTLTWAPVINPPTVEVNNGVDDVIVKEDGTVDVPITAALGDNPAAGEFLTVTVTGIDPSWGFSAPIGTYDDTTGTWTVVLAPGESLDTLLTFTPPADSDIDLSGLVATATATDPDAGISADSAPDSFNIIVDAVADDPEITAEDDSGDEGTPLDVDLSALTGEEVNNGVGSDDGSETIVKYQISGIPDGFTPSAGTEVSPGVWEFTPDEIIGLTITPDDPNFSGSINLVATVFTTENPGDGEPDSADNTNSASDPFTLTWAPVINPPTVEVNNGVDDVIVKEDGTVDVPITAALGDNPAAGEFLTVTVTGIDPSWGFSAPIGTYDDTTGTWTVVLAPGESLDTLLTFTPPADSDIDLSGLVATATATDPDAGISADSAPDSFNIIVDAVADEPTVDGGDDLCVEDGNSIPFTISTDVTDTDGSEVIEAIVISGLPEGVTLSAGTYDPVEDTWTLMPDQLDGLTLNVPEGTDEGDYTITIESIAFEQNTSGGEPDTSDNRASNTDTVVLSVKDDDVPVIVLPEIANVDETNLDPTTSVTGQVEANFGDDTPGDFTANGFSFIDGLTSQGEPITVDFDADTNTYTGSTSAGDVFTMVIQSDGEYTFTLLAPVDHPDPNNPNEAVALRFGVTATDADGDTDTANIIITVLDDAPSAEPQYSFADESTLAVEPIVINRTFDFDFGNDGAGELRLNGNFTVKYEPGGANQPLTSGGVDVDVDLNPDGTGYVGTIGDLVIFTLDVDLSTGSYTYTQFVAIDHPEGLDPADDVLWLQFGIDVVDFDGDTVSTIIGIDLYDDEPVAEDDMNSGEQGEVISGNVIDNDDQSVDVDNTIQSVSFDGVSYDLPVDGSDIMIEGDFGTLTINNTGAYSYVANDNALGKTYTYSIDNPPGSDGGGDIKNVTTSYNEATDDFEFSLTVGPESDGFTLALNGGPNPKGHEAEMALVYFDASGPEPVITIYAYNGLNTLTSWQDGSGDPGAQAPDTILSSLTNPELFDFITVSTDSDGNNVFSFALDATLIQEHDPLYGPDGEWTGVSFGDLIGMWLHPVTGLETSYNDDGYLSQWTITGQGWYDTANRPTGSEHPECVVDEFGYVLVDGDGDTDNAVLTIKTLEDDDQPVIADPDAIAVDETDLAGGSVVEGSVVTADFGDDTPGTFTPTGVDSFGFAGAKDGALTSNNVPVDVTLVGDTYFGKADGVDIFTLKIETDGDYTFTLLGPLDHADMDDPNDMIDLTFGVTANDSDDDSADATITVKVFDDGPVAADDDVAFDKTLGEIDGNVLDNDTLSQDDANTVTQIEFDGNVINVDPDTGAIIEGKFGSLEIFADGSYTYTLCDDGSGETASLDPVKSDVDGLQDVLTKNGITITIDDPDNADIFWLDTADGSGLGIDNLNTNDSKKVWPKGETFNISFEENAKAVTLTIAEIGDNNDDGNHGVDFKIFFTDGSYEIGEQEFTPGEIIDGTITFTIDSADYDGREIESIDLYSTNAGQELGASFLLNNVEVEYGGCDCATDTFTYTVTDADGDADTATLTLECIEGELIVGENVDDNGDSDVPHRVGGDEGVITGTDGADILVGDAGGSFLQQDTQDYNMVFMLDVSGSMGNPVNASSRISLLIDAMQSLMTNIGAYEDGNVKVHMVTFNTDTTSEATFMVTDADDLADAIAYLEGLTTGGYTNYEAPLQSAINWLEGGEPLGGDAITYSYFISDGEPNRFINEDGNPQSGNVATVTGEITGSDGTNEVLTLQTLSDEVIGVGIDVSSAIARLNIIDSDGDAINIDEPGDLTAALEDLNPVLNLDAVGDDVLEGGESNDIIFGDVLFTDDLAFMKGLSVTDGSGWDVFEKLEAGESAVSPDWDREDTIAYIRDNAESLAQESVNSLGDGRSGGNDVISGGAGDDLIFGQEGNDVISGGEGNDIIFGGSGADIFLFESVDEGFDEIMDFDVAEGDLLDLSTILSDLTSGSPVDMTTAINNFVIATEVGGDTIISIDPTGTSTGTGSINLAILHDVTGLDLTTAIKADTTV